MNRIQLLDLQFDERTSALSDHPSRPTNNDSTRPPAHRFFVPLHYEKNYAYPLIVWLHGPTGDESEIKQVMPHISMRNYVGVSLRGPLDHETRTEAGDPTFTWDQDPRTVEFALEDVARCVSLARQRFSIASDRIFLVGNDVGGTMALRLALTAPGQFAGVASLGGPLPTTHNPLARIQEARTIPVMLMQCRDSDTYTTDHACQDLRLLHAAGIPVTLRQYPCEQEVATQMLSDINAWVMEQVSGVTHTDCVVDDPTHLRLEDHN
jgi:phospholipase/carboxylesterase